MFGRTKGLEKVQSVDVLGSKLFVLIDTFQECLGLKFTGLFQGKLVYFDCLARHDQEELKNCGKISQAHLDGALENFRKILEGNLLEKDKYDEHRYRYSPAHREYFNWHDIDGDITALSPEEIAELVWEDMSFHQRNRDWEWYSSGDLLSVCKPIVKAWMKEWKNLPETDEYIKSQATKYAEEWAAMVNTTGSSGDGLADLLHGVLRSKIDRADLGDTDRFKVAVFEYAINTLVGGNSLRLSTDYSPDFELRELLSENNLSHMGSNFPWKTQVRLDWEDFPRLGWEG